MKAMYTGTYCALCNHIHKTIQNTELSLHHVYEQVITDNKSGLSGKLS